MGSAQAVFYYWVAGWFFHCLSRVDRVRLPSDQVLPGSPGRAFQLMSNHLRFSNGKVHVQLLPILRTTYRVVVYVISHRRRGQYGGRFPILSTLRPKLRPYGRIFGNGASLRYYSVSFVLYVDARQLFRRHVANVYHVFNSVPRRGR